MGGVLIRSYRGLLYALIAVLVFTSGYFWGRLHHTIERADPGVRTAALRQGPGKPGAGLAGSSPFALPGRGGAPDWIGSLTGPVPGDMAAPAGAEEDAKDIHQLEMMDQESALLERETISEMAQSLMDSGVPGHDIESILNGVAVYRGNRVEREMTRAGLPRPVARSKEDLAQELKTSLLNASASDADVEGMVNSLFLDLENPVLPDHPEPEIPPRPVP